jgi:hypothetical protein
MICKGKEEVRERKERASCGDGMFGHSLASDLVGLTITPPWLRIELLQRHLSNCCVS